MLQHIAGKHYRILLQSFRDAQRTGQYDRPWGKITPRGWATSAGLPFADKLPNEVLNRSALRDELRETKDHAVAAALGLGWGEMKVSNARRLFDKTEWQSILHQLRAGCYTPCEAYKRFWNMQAQGEIPRMGPAYYTKLIFFLCPALQNGTGHYIMDQWTGRSVNLLCGQKIVLMQKSGKNGMWVNNKNTTDNYKQFNVIIDNIACRWRKTGEEVEMALFDRGGHKRGKWREYVREHG